jgi:hypothetical protein
MKYFASWWFAFCFNRSRGAVDRHFVDQKKELSWNRQAKGLFRLIKKKLEEREQMDQQSWGARKNGSEMTCFMPGRDVHQVGDWVVGRACNQASREIMCLVGSGGDLLSC